MFKNPLFNCSNGLVATHKPLQIYNYKLIDYIKILVIGIDKESLLKSLDFKVGLVENTGEVSIKQVAEYHCCKITVYDSGTILFTGSIHNMWNSLNDIKAPNHKEEKKHKGFNGNQFTINNILKVRTRLCKVFNCCPEQMIFQNIEFGVNTTPLFDPQKFIKGLLYHNGKKFEFRYNEHFAQVVHQRYLLKIYSKSYQYCMSEYTLRVELKIIKMEEIKSLGIKTFADVNTINLNKAKDLLLKRFDEVLYYDYTISRKRLKVPQKRALDNYSNPRHWINTLKPRNRVYHKGILKELIKSYSSQLKDQISSNMIQKFGIINRLSETLQFGIINHSSIELKTTISTPKGETKICPITKVDISMQKSDSFLLSNTGLKHLEEHDNKQFNLIAEVLLTGNKNEFEKNIHSRIAKQIRNKYFNNRSFYVERQSKLF